MFGKAGVTQCLRSINEILRYFWIDDSSSRQAPQRMIPKLTITTSGYLLPISRSWVMLRRRIVVTNMRVDRTELMSRYPWCQLGSFILGVFTGRSYLASISDRVSAGNYGLVPSASSVHHIQYYVSSTYAVITPVGPFLDRYVMEENRRSIG